ncbi:GNAT family N-acetyltransferase [Aerococcaceae bacterium WGS1372]
MEFRLVSSTDYEAMWRIYQQYIDSNITFEYVLPTLSEFSERINHITEDYACIVCDDGGELLGYAYAHRFALRAGYNWAAELSVYTSKQSNGLGIGKRLYQAIIDICKIQGIQTVYGIVTVGNVASELLHEKFGFQRVGTLNKVGYKNNQWLSCSYYEKAIGHYSTPVDELKKIKQIELKQIEAVLKQ